LGGPVKCFSPHIYNFGNYSKFNSIHMAVSEVLSEIFAYQYVGVGHATGQK